MKPILPRFWLVFGTFLILGNAANVAWNVYRNPRGWSLWVAVFSLTVATLCVGTVWAIERRHAR